MSKKKTSTGKKGRYTSYKVSNRLVTNATKKLERHLRKHPNDVQNTTALRSVTSKKHRSTPNKKLGWVTPAVAELATASSPHLPPNVAKISSNNVTKESAILASKVIKIVALASRSESPMFDKNMNIIFKHKPLKHPITGANMARILRPSVTQRLDREAEQARRLAAIEAKKLSATAAK